MRVSFNVNPETGNISNFTKWKQYDPRQRPWFKHAVAQWEEQQGKHAWSSIYPFAANGKLGASKLSNRVLNIRSCVHARERVAAQTRRIVSPAVHSSRAQRCTHNNNKIKREQGKTCVRRASLIAGITATAVLLNNTAHVVSVLGVDYEMSTLASLMKTYAADDNSTTLYVVETSNQTSGLLVCSSTEQPLLDPKSNARIYATQSGIPTVRASAQLLAAAAKPWAAPAEGLDLPAHRTVVRTRAFVDVRRPLDPASTTPYTMSC